MTCLSVLEQVALILAEISQAILEILPQIAEAQASLSTITQ